MKLYFLSFGILHMFGLPREQEGETHLSPVYPSICIRRTSDCSLKLNSRTFLEEVECSNNM